MKRAAASGILICAFVMTAGQAAGEPLRYQPPPGWVDLADSATDVSTYPKNAVNEARSGKYRLYAVDPATVSPAGVAAMMNVLEHEGGGVITKDVLQQACLDAFQKARAVGYDMTILDSRLTKLGDVDVGVIDSTLGNASGKLRLVQYMIPGKPRSAIVTYGCSPAELDRYRPLFERSAMATTGANASGWFNWQQAMGGALKGALLGALIGSITWALVRNGRRPRAQVPAPPSAATPVTWACPVCKRRVPLRVSVCRCGAERPPA